MIHLPLQALILVVFRFKPSSYQGPWFTNMTWCPTFTLRENQRKTFWSSNIWHTCTFSNRCLVSYHRSSWSDSASFSLQTGWSLETKMDIVSEWQHNQLCRFWCFFFLLYMLLTSGPGAPIWPGVPETPCKTQKHTHLIHYFKMFWTTQSSLYVYHFLFINNSYEYKTTFGSTWSGDTFIPWLQLLLTRLLAHQALHVPVGRLKFRSWCFSHDNQ